MNGLHIIEAPFCSLLSIYNIFLFHGLQNITAKIFTFVYWSKSFNNYKRANWTIGASTIWTTISSVQASNEVIWKYK